MLFRSVKSYLPRGIKPENVVEKGELELAYDVRQGQYYVYKEVKLKPKASVTYEIEIEDIWLIDEEKLNTLKSHAEELAGKLKKTEYKEVSGKLKEMIEKNIVEILEKQTSYAIDRVSPIEHISAYEANKEMLDIVKEDVGTLENLVIGLGGDPGKIMGESSIGAKTIEEITGQLRGKSASQSARTEGSKARVKGISTEEFKGLKLAAFKTAMFKVAVENPSQTETQIIPVKYYLPKEVKADDVIDLGELELGFDFEKAVFGSIDLVYEKELGIPTETIIKLPEITFENPPKKNAA